MEFSSFWDSFLIVMEFLAHYPVTSFKAAVIIVVFLCLFLCLWYGVASSRPRFRTIHILLNRVFQDLSQNCVLSSLLKLFPLLKLWTYGTTSARSWFKTGDNFVQYGFIKIPVNPIKILFMIFDGVILHGTERNPGEYIS